MPAHIEIEGLRELQRGLRRIDKELTNELKKANKDAGEAVVEAARPEAPELTGKLKGSLRAANKVREAEVRLGGAKVPWAGPIHFGWPARNIEPDPFVYRALDKRRDEVRDAYMKRIDALRKHL